MKIKVERKVATDLKPFILSRKGYTEQLKIHNEEHLTIHYGNCKAHISMRQYKDMEKPPLLSLT